MRSTLAAGLAAILAFALFFTDDGAAQEAKKKRARPPEQPWVEPKLPDGKTVVSDVTDDFLKAPEKVLREGVTTARRTPSSTGPSVSGPRPARTPGSTCSRSPTGSPPAEPGPVRRVGEGTAAPTLGA